MKVIRGLAVVICAGLFGAALLEYLVGAPEAQRRALPAVSAPPPLALAEPDPSAPRRPRTGPRADVDAGMRDFLRDLAQAEQESEQAERDALVNPPGSEGATIDQRLELFRDALERRISGVDPARLMPYRSVMGEVFLRNDPVQRELAEMTPAERAQQLARIRRELGYGDQEIAQLAREDDVKESRWQNGRAYMDERKRLLETYQGETLEQELALLRTRRFSIAAKTIEREEQSGFFRFERPRVYGRN